MCMMCPAMWFTFECEARVRSVFASVRIRALTVLLAVRSNNPRSDADAASMASQIHQKHDTIGGGMDLQQLGKRMAASSSGLQQGSAFDDLNMRMGGLEDLHLTESEEEGEPNADDDEAEANETDPAKKPNGKDGKTEKNTNSKPRNKWFARDQAIASAVRAHKKWHDEIHKRLKDSFDDMSKASDEFDELPEGIKSRIQNEYDILRARRKPLGLVLGSAEAVMSKDEMASARTSDMCPLRCVVCRSSDYVFELCAMRAVSACLSRSRWFAIWVGACVRCVHCEISAVAFPF